MVWLDQPLPLVMARLVRRAFVDIATQRDLFNGNRQSWRHAFFERDSLVAYAVAEHFRRRRETPAYFAARPHVRLLRIRHPSELEAFLARAIPYESARP